MFRVDLGVIQPIPFGAMVKDKGKAVDRVQGRRAYLARAHRRRFQSLQHAAHAAEILPEEGESVHVLMTGFYDLMHLLVVLLDRFGSTCDTMRIGTLSLSRRNVQEMVSLIDDGKVKRLDVLVSDFFRRHDDDIFAELVKDFHARGQRVGAARSHAKIVTIALEDGRRYVFHGSPNLRTNRNIEQLAIERDADLHAHYDRWLDEMVTHHAA